MLLEKPKFWDKKKDNFLSILLLPFSLLILLNNWLKKFQIKKKFKIKTICVGNIYIGGTGKTPLSIEIFKILKSLKFRAVFVKKFYSSHIDEYKLLSKSTNDWVSLMEKEKIPCGPIFNIKEAVENPQIKARNMIVNSYHKKIGEFKTAGNPIKMSNYKDEEKRGDIPDLDEHRAKIIKEFCN